MAAQTPTTRRLEDDILRSLRRLTRAIDLHSRQLVNTYGLTGPQLVSLRALSEVEHTTPSALAQEVALSQGTVTGIIDRLAARQLVTRERNPKDRRLVTVKITEAGRALSDQAPSPLQETFTKQLAELAPAEQTQIRDTLQRVVRMMGGEGIEAAPVLSTSPAAQSAAEAKDAPKAGITDVLVPAAGATAVDPESEEEI